MEREGDAERLFLLVHFMVETKTGNRESIKGVNCNTKRKRETKQNKMSNKNAPIKKLQSIMSLWIG